MGKPLNCLSSHLFSGYATFCRKSFTTDMSHGYKQGKGVQRYKSSDQDMPIPFAGLAFAVFQNVVRQQRAYIWMSLYFRGFEFFGDWINSTVLIHRVQTLSWTKNPRIFHGGIESLLSNSRTSNKVCSNSCFRDFTTTVTSHITLESPSSLPPNTHPLPWESIALWPNHATLKNLQKDCFSAFKLYKLAKTRVRLDQICLSKLFAEFFLNISTKSF